MKEVVEVKDATSSTGTSSASDATSSTGTRSGSAGDSAEKKEEKNDDNWAPTMVLNKVEAHADRLFKELLSQSATPGHIKGLDQFFADSVRMEPNKELEKLADTIVNSVQNFLDERVGQGE